MGSWQQEFFLGMFKQGVGKQRVTTSAWRPGSHYAVAATRDADSVLASDRRAKCGRPSTRRGCRICVTVRLPVRPRGETIYWQANVNYPPFPLPLFLNVPDFHLRPLRKSILLTSALVGKLKGITSKGFFWKTYVDNVQIRCIVKGEAQKYQIVWWFSVFFSQERLFSRNSTRKPLK